MAARVLTVLILFFLLLHLLAAAVAAHNPEQVRLAAQAAAAVLLGVLALLVHQGRETLVVIPAALTVLAVVEVLEQSAA
jgi:hypothetical protein